MDLEMVDMAMANIFQESNHGIIFYLVFGGTTDTNATGTG